MSMFLESCGAGRLFTGSDGILKFAISRAIQGDIRGPEAGQEFK